jgi:hypothetical protein
VVRYAPRTRASVAYERLTAELLQRLRTRR